MERLKRLKIAGQPCKSPAFQASPRQKEGFCEQKATEVSKTSQTVGGVDCCKTMGLQRCVSEPQTDRGLLRKGLKGISY